MTFSEKKFCPKAKNRILIKKPWFYVQRKKAKTGSIRYGNTARKAKK